jgi:hypothetical protein
MSNSSKGRPPWQAPGVVTRRGLRSMFRNPFKQIPIHERSFTVDPQVASPLFNGRIPPEIRNQIFLLALTEYTLHPTRLHWQACGFHCSPSNMSPYLLRNLPVGEILFWHRRVVSNLLGHDFILFFFNHTLS